MGARLAQAQGQPGTHWLVTAPLLVVLAGISLLAFFSLDAQALRGLRAGMEQPRITILDLEGLQIAQLGGGRGTYVTLDRMSPFLPNAVVAIEDHRFFHHVGVDPIGIMRALISNLRAGRIAQGGSTITQQLAKLSFLTPERSLARKLKELWYTLWIEARFDKNRILEAYLNKVYLGGGAYGVDAAARRYFNKSALELDLAESAMLAGLIKAPSRYAPTRGLSAAQARAKVVLDRMVAAGFIGENAAAAAAAAPARLVARPTQRETGYFIDWIGQESRLYAGPLDHDLTVETTLDSRLQAIAASVVDEVFSRYGAAYGVEQAALIAMTLDGQVRAMLGGRSYAQSQFNRAIQASRQPGSAFKLFLYLAALEAGIEPEDRISARPIAIDGWQPRNADDRYPAEISVQRAFTHSVNTAAVRLSETIGRHHLRQMARQLGITTGLHEHASLALGSAEVTLIELTAAYATVANQGRLVWPEGIRSLAGRNGRLLYQRRPLEEQVLNPATAEAMVAMLQDTLIQGTGWRAQLPGFAAGKTGTSSNYRDAWFIGFTDQMVLGIWTGNDDGRPMKEVSGGGVPALIFKKVVERARIEAPPTVLDPTILPKEPVAALRDPQGGLMGALADALAQ